MLQELTIKNFAIIESLSLAFEEGMTVLTGETGAGKSIIIDALGLLIGGRGSSHFIRHGEEKLELEALFFIDEKNKALRTLLMENGIDVTDDMIVLERILFENGKNSCRLNGKLVTTTFLRKIGSKLIDIHSQHKHQELMQEEKHLMLLDHFAWKELAAPLENYQATFANYQKAKKEWTNRIKNDQELAQRLDILKFQEQEIREANLLIDEENDLLEKRKILANFESLNAMLRGAYAALENEPGGLHFIGEAMRKLEDASLISNEYKTLSETISSSYYMIEDVMIQIGKLLDKIEFQPEELNQIETRLQLINQLKRKYGKTIPDIIQYHDHIQTEIARLNDHESHMDQLEKSLKSLKLALDKKSTELTRIRKKAASSLEKKIKSELNQLYMEKAIFKVDFTVLKLDFTENGTDQVRFFMSTNPGEPLKPLTKIASGGELSRMMLALKTIFSKHQGITSIIFDEVDTGVSGRVAQAIAEKIYTVSIGSQVLCISHLPQVAAIADQHLYITKTIQNKRTTTSVIKLTTNQKVAEISRMIAGTEVTELAKQHAKELIDQAQIMKQK